MEKPTRGSNEAEQARETEASAVDKTGRGVRSSMEGWVKNIQYKGGYEWCDPRKRSLVLRNGRRQNIFVKYRGRWQKDTRYSVRGACARSNSLKHA